MRAQRLGGMRVQVEREYEGHEVGMGCGYKWRESMRDQRLGWDEGTSGEREYEGPEVGVG